MRGQEIGIVFINVITTYISDIDSYVCNIKQGIIAIQSAKRLFFMKSA